MDLETVSWDDVAEIESLDFATDEGRPLDVYAWVRLRDGRGALWEFQVGALGQDQRLRVIEGA